MVRLNLAGVHVKTSQDDRLADALRDLDEQRKRAQAAEQDVANLADDLADARNDAEALQGDLTSASHEIDRLKQVVKVYEATALPRLDPDGGLVSTGTVDALIGEALDMEMGGGELEGGPTLGPDRPPGFPFSPLPPGETRPS